MAANKTLNLNGATRLAGVIGWPIAHTLSPAMQNAAFKAAGLNVVYVPLGVQPSGLPHLLQALRHLPCAGVNVTIPFKEQVIPLVDRCAPSARQMGAVNTIVFTHGELIGHNTDGFGFMESLKGKINPRGKKAVVLGTGGGGRAVAISLALAKVKRLTLADLDPGRLAKLIRDIGKLGYTGVGGCKPGSPELRQALAEAELLVNATPLGLKPKDPLPLLPDWMPKNVCVMDLVYGRTLTPFLQLAQKNHNKIIPGWNMLLHQGAEAFRLWTGKKSPLAVMEQSLRSAGRIKAH